MNIKIISIILSIVFIVNYSPIQTINKANLSISGTGTNGK